MHYVTIRRSSMNKKITLIAVMFLMVSIFEGCGRKGPGSKNGSAQGVCAEVWR